MRQHLSVVAVEECMQLGEGCKVEVGKCPQNLVVFKNTSVIILGLILSAYSFSFLPVFLGSSTEWMLGSTPPAAMVTPDRSLDSSSSLRTAS